MLAFSECYNGAAKTSHHGTLLLTVKHIDTAFHCGVKLADVFSVAMLAQVPSTSRNYSACSGGSSVDTLLNMDRKALEIETIDQGRNLSEFVCGFMECTSVLSRLPTWARVFRAKEMLSQLVLQIWVFRNRPDLRLEANRARTRSSGS